MLRDFVQDQLEQGWSPEQIVQALHQRFPNRPERHVVHETGWGQLGLTIYRALELAARIPDARVGCVEVRPIGEFTPASGATT